MEICYRRRRPEPPTCEAHVKADQEHPLLLDRFLENAIEVDVDALADGEDVHVAGIMQHVEEAGVHSGDSACVLPPMSLGEEMLDEIRATTQADRPRARRHRPDQHPVRGRRRRALRDRGQPARLAHRALRQQGDRRAAGQDRLPADARRAARRPGAARRCRPATSRVKEAVLPFARFAGADAVLGPEMKSTGEVMGIARRLPDRLRQGAGRRRRRAAERGARSSSPSPTPTSRRRPRSPPASTTSASRSLATGGTAQAISAMGVPVEAINKIGEGSPHVVDCIRAARSTS